MISVYEDIVKT